MYGTVDSFAEQTTGVRIITADRKQTKNNFKQIIFLILKISTTFRG
jgi:hypothetical protein